MSDSKLVARLDDLEIRYAHQESALDELTRSVLVQEQQIRQQTDLLERLEKQVRALQGGTPVAGPDDKPPHY